VRGCGGLSSESGMRTGRTSVVVIGPLEWVVYTTLIADGQNGSVKMVTKNYKFRLSVM